MKTRSVIVWFRNDLRLSDHPALHAALERGLPIVPVFVWSPHDEGAWPLGSASRVWLRASLAALEQGLAKRGSRLVYREGPTAPVLAALAREVRAEAVHWNRRYEPAALKCEQAVEKALAAEGVATASFDGGLLFAPWAIEKKQGGPYRVFTQFWKRCLEQPEPESPLPAPKRLPAPDAWPESKTLESLSLDAGGIPGAWGALWTPGEAAAKNRLAHFLDTALPDYCDGRDLPAQDGTSRLSPHLHFGEISPRQVWHAVQARAASDTAGAGESAEKFLSELGWREFSYHLLYHFPHTTHDPLDKRFEHLEWRGDEVGLEAWRAGRTGYPIVDAGMRQLQSVGWMHNRVRMIVASFLTKDLLVPWQEGAAWFWETLVDADLANNTQGWQWTAGCGADAAPFFRVFNPVSQGERFDPEGAYVKRWVPELAALPTSWIHEPWKAPGEVLEKAGVVIGQTYPRPILDHAIARKQALAAFAALSA